MKKTYSIIATIGLALAPLAFAQAPAAQPAPANQPQTAAQAPIPPDQQATREQVLQLFTALRMRKRYDHLKNLITATAQQAARQGMEQAMAKVPDAHKLTPTQQRQLNGILEKYLQKSMHLYTADEMIEDAIPVYQHNLRRSDVGADIAYYSSPAGRRLLDAEPVIMKELMPVIMAREKERSKSLQTEMMRDVMNFIKSQIPQSAPSAK
jgi:uncharacterized protein